MKPPHEMTALERRESIEKRLENAEYLAKLNGELAQHDPSLYAPIAAGWAKEAKRLREALKP